MYNHYISIWIWYWMPLLFFKVTNKNLKIKTLNLWETTLLNCATIYLRRHIIIQELPQKLIQGRWITGNYLNPRVFNVISVCHVFLKLTFEFFKFWFGAEAVRFGMRCAGPTKSALDGVHVGARSLDHMWTVALKSRRNISPQMRLQLRSIFFWGF